jgi:hypothetical protein
MLLPEQEPSTPWNWDPPTLQLVDAHAPLADILASEGFLQSYNAATPKLIAYLTQPCVLEELLSLIASSANLRIPQLLRPLFTARVRACDALFSAYATCAESAFRLINTGSSLASGVLLEFFALSLQNNPGAVLDVLALGAPFATEVLLRNVAHPAVAIGLLPVLENGWQSLEYLVWHLFVGVLGRDAIVAIPPRRRRDHALAYPTFGAEQRVCAIELVSAWTRKRKGDRYLADAMLENLVALANFDPNCFRIAEHLPQHPSILEKAKVAFRAIPEARVFAIAYFKDQLLHDEIASVVHAVFKSESMDRHLLAGVADFVQLALAKAEALASDLALLLPFVWNFCSIENEKAGTWEVKLAYLLDLMALVSSVVAEQSEHWRQFAAEVIFPWKDIGRLRWEIKFPAEAVHSEYVRKVAPLMAYG